MCSSSGMFHISRNSSWLNVRDKLASDEIAGGGGEHAFTFKFDRKLYDDVESQPTFNHVLGISGLVILPRRVSLESVNLAGVDGCSFFEIPVLRVDCGQLESSIIHSSRCR